MTLIAARVILKQHRLEIGLGVLAAVGFASWAATVEIRTALVSVPAGCFQVWRSIGPDGAGACLDPIRAWSNALATDGDSLIHAMAYVPFAIGLLAGVPIVAGELEGRTAQTAWALFGSRPRWLAHQVIPAAAVLGVAMVALTLATAAVENDRVIFGYSPVEDLGHYGWELIPECFTGLGVGLLIGALVRRPLPAFVLGAATIGGLVMAIGLAHQAWTGGLTPTVIPDDAGRDAVVTAVDWRSPTGQLLPVKDAEALAHAGGAPLPGPDDPQDNPAIAWLQGHGYAEVDLGVSMETALRWGFYEGSLYVLAGLAAGGAAIWETRRIRPT